MSSSFTLRLDTTQSERAIQRLKERAPIAIARALNRSVKSARQELVEAIANDTGLKQTKVRDRINLREAYPEPSGLRATVFASPARIPLIEWGATGPQPSRGRGQGVRVQFRVMGQRRRYAKLFLVTMRSGHTGVFGRVGASTRKSLGAWSKNLPISERRGPSIVHVAARYARQAAIRGRESLAKNLEHEMSYLLGKPGATTIA